LTGDGSAGNPLDIAQQGATDGQVLKWNAAYNAWEPANDIGGGAGDDWGSQVVQHDATLSGDGTTGNELKLAQQGATDGQVLKWDSGVGRWIPANDSVGSGSGGGVGGSGTDNYIPRWNGTTDLENSSIYQADGGNVGIGTTTPSAQLELSGASGTGLIVDNPGMDGIFIENPISNGVVIDSANNYGVKITNSYNRAILIDGVTNDAIEIKHAGGYGVVIDSPYIDGIYIGHSWRGMTIYGPSQTGIWISRAGHHGIEVDSCAWAGLYINSPAANGIDINTSSTSNCGIKIFSHSGDYPDTAIAIKGGGSPPLTDKYGIVIDSMYSVGVSITNVNGSGIYISNNNGLGIDIVNSNLDAIWIENSGYDGIVIHRVNDDGITIDSTGDDGIYINNAGDDGVYIVDAGYNGVRISESYDDGIYIDSPGDDGVSVSFPGGNCFVCDGTPHLFRVSNACEVFGHSYNQYIVDNEGRGVVAPISASTERWLEHIGEAQLHDGVCRVDLPKKFLEGVFIDKNNPLHIFISPTSPMGEYWIEKGETYFIVHQTSGGFPDATFDYRVVAKIWGCEDDRIKSVDVNDFIDDNGSK